MKRDTVEWLENLMKKLGINTEIDENLCGILNHRELLYLYVEICNSRNKIMPYEYMRSVNLIESWLSENAS